MSKYRFLTVYVSGGILRSSRPVQVLQIQKSVDVSSCLDSYPDCVDRWVDADRWEAEEFLQTKSCQSPPPGDE